MANSQQFHRFEDGHIEVEGEWLPRMIISDELLTPPYMSDMVTVEGELVTFHVSNGTATYKRAEQAYTHSHWHDKVG